MNAKTAAVISVLAIVCMVGACGQSGNAAKPSTSSSQNSTLQREHRDDGVRKQPADGACATEPWNETRPETAPIVEWKYQDQTLWPYPVSEQLGPFQSDKDGYRHCYAHSPSGAVLAAANIAAMMTDHRIMTDADSLIKLFGKGPQYETIKEKLKSETLTHNSSSGVRAELYGFKILDAKETSAIIDLGYQASADGRNINMSIVYNLTWDDGDWKLQSESTVPISSAVLSSFVNYIPWRET